MGRLKTIRGNVVVNLLRMLPQNGNNITYLCASLVNNLKPASIKESNMGILNLGGYSQAPPILA